ncbi:MAG: tetratricopeptide repeat protein, partial [Chloroflexi bacterium]|nr:tetratricopeptide repeat protein [Chloroflexota bacterium]
MSGNVGADVNIAGDDIIGRDQISTEEFTGGDRVTATSAGIAIAGGAGDDTITITQGEEQTGPEFLQKIRTWVEQNALIAILGFIVITLIPTAVFYFEVIQPLVTPPDPMTGEWNVAVAVFTPQGDQPIRNRDAQLIAEVFAGRVENEFAERGENIDLTLQVRGPSEVGRVQGQTAVDRAANAADLAEQINANVVVYGVVELVDGEYQLRPEFYVRIDNSFETEELLGQHAFGSPVQLIGERDSIGPQLSTNQILSDRSEAFALITRGLSLYFTTAYDDAYSVFQEANRNDLWETTDGREVLYLFQGNAASRALLIDEAEEAYERALDIEPEYARGYAGLAGVVYLQAIEDLNIAVSLVDMAGLEESIALYDQALAAEINPPSADVDTKAAFGLGQIYLVQALAGEPTAELAIEEF